MPFLLGSLLFYDLIKGKTKERTKSNFNLKILIFRNVYQNIFYNVLMKISTNESSDLLNFRKKKIKVRIFRYVLLNVVK